MQKEYDVLLTANNLAEKNLKEVESKVLSMKGLDMALMNDSEAVKDTVQSLSQQTIDVLEDLLCEQRTAKMQGHMMTRLREEISDCRVETAKATVFAEQAKHDFLLASNSLQSNRQDLLEDEAAFDKLLASMKTKKEHRDLKLSMLNSISVEGETSVMKLQQSLFAASPVVAHRPRSTFAKKRVKTPSKGSGALQSVDLEEDFDSDIFGNTDVVALAKKMNPTEVKNALQRYNSQTIRMEKLQQLEEDLRKNIKYEQQKKNELTEQLTHSGIKIAQLASTRQVYQEVDLKDSALAATTKQCDDCKERDFRLKVQIEELKLAVPRFLTKVTKVSHPKPTESQLGDAVIKLEEELIKLIKFTGSALLKDATPDDLALMSQQQPNVTTIAVDSNSEFSRLQRMPGFSRLQRQIFFNLMTARPDVSDGNKRIDNTAVSKLRHPKTTGGGMIAPKHPDHVVQITTFANGNPSRGGRKTAGVTAGGGNKDVDVDQDWSDVGNSLESRSNAALDRATIKSISKLIYDRDSSKSSNTTTHPHSSRNYH